MGAQVRSLFGRLNAVIAPIAPVTAFPHDHRPFWRPRVADIRRRQVSLSLA